MFKSYKILLLTLAISFLAASANAEPLDIESRTTYPVIMWNNAVQSETKESTDLIMGSEAIANV